MVFTAPAVSPRSEERTSRHRCHRVTPEDGSCVYGLFERNPPAPVNSVRRDTQLVAVLPLSA